MKTASQPGRLPILDADVTDAASASVVAVSRVPAHVIVGARCDRAYVSNADDNAVALVEMRTRRLIATIPVGRSPVQVFATLGGNFMYVAKQGAEQAPDNTVSVIDTRLNAVVQTLTTDRGAHGVAVSDDGSRVFIANTFAGTVSTIDAVTQRVTRAVRVGSGSAASRTGPHRDECTQD